MILLSLKPHERIVKGGSAVLPTSQYSKKTYRGKHTHTHTHTFTHLCNVFTHTPHAQGGRLPAETRLLLFSRVYSREKERHVSLHVELDDVAQHRPLAARFNDITAVAELCPYLTSNLSPIQSRSGRAGHVVCF